MLNDIIRYVFTKYVFLRKHDFTETAINWFNNGLRARITGIWVNGSGWGIFLVRTEDKLKKNVRGRWN